MPLLHAAAWVLLSLPLLAAVVAQPVLAQEVAGPDPGAASEPRTFHTSPTSVEQRERRGDFPVDNTGHHQRSPEELEALGVTLQVRVEPAPPVVGKPYRVSFVFSNAGQVTWHLDRLLVISVVDGRRGQGPLPSRESTVKSGEKEVSLFEMDLEEWRDVETWAIEVGLEARDADDDTSLYVFKSRTEWP